MSFSESILSSFRHAFLNPIIRKAKILTVCSTVPSAYLVCWDNLGVYSGIYEWDSWPDFIAIGAFGLLALIGILAVLLTFKNRQYFLAIIPIIILSIYLTRICHGPQVTKLQDCDFSTCSDLIFYADGSFYFSKIDQIEEITKTGFVQLSGDTLLLIPTTFYLNLNWLRLDKETIESKGLIRPVGFDFTYTEEFDK